MPKPYKETLYMFLVGCLWVKFTVIFDNVIECISELIRHSDPLEKQNVIQ